MYPTDHAVFRHFWYPVLPSADLRDSPRAFTLLDEPLVLWRDSAGKAAAMRDRCSHCSAKLSCGKRVGDTIACGYHGWQFDSAGRCVHIPQQPERRPALIHHVPAYACRERYGYVWVALAEPLRDIPDFAEDSDAAYRRIPCFYERWETSAFRTMENELDMAHFPYVHLTTFGDQTRPDPLSIELSDIDPWTLLLRASLSTVAPPEQARNTHMPEGDSSRTMDITWFLPFTVRLDIRYRSGLRHVVINNSTPIGGKAVQVVQFHYRSDTEADVPTAQLLAFEARIVAEDRQVLESTDPSVEISDFSAEAHLPTDRAGLLMRRKLAAAIAAFDARQGPSMPSVA